MICGETALQQRTLQPCKNETNDAHIQMLRVPTYKGGQTTREISRPSQTQNRLTPPRKQMRTSMLSIVCKTSTARMVRTLCHLGDFACIGTIYRRPDLRINKTDTSQTTSSNVRPKRARTLEKLILKLIPTRVCDCTHSSKRP